MGDGKIPHVNAVSAIQKGLLADAIPAITSATISRAKPYTAPAIMETGRQHRAKMFHAARTANVANASTMMSCAEPSRIMKASASTAFMSKRQHARQHLARLPKNAAVNAEMAMSNARISRASPHPLHALMACGTKNHAPLRHSAMLRAKNAWNVSIMTRYASITRRGKRISPKNGNAAWCATS